MRIAMVGGLDRNARVLERLAADAGHELEVHAGKLAGRGAEVLRRLVERVDLLVLTPDVNSHGAVQLGKKVARERGVPVEILATCGVARFRALLERLGGDRKAA